MHVWAERGEAHRKPTRFLASHEELLVDLDRQCDHSHKHDLVMGGPSVTARTGHYTSDLARSIARGVLNFFGPKEALNVDEVSEADPEEVDDRGFVDYPATEEPWRKRRS